jgi:hypothetical protein
MQKLQYAIAARREASTSKEERKRIYDRNKHSSYYDFSIAVT